MLLPVSLISPVYKRSLRNVRTIYATSTCYTFFLPSPTCRRQQSTSSLSSSPSSRLAKTQHYTIIMGRNTSVSMSTSLIELGSLVSKEKPDKLRTQLLDIFDTGLNAASPSDLTAETIVGEIDKLYPTSKDGDGVEDFLWALWTFYANVAKRVPAEDERQQLLVMVVEKLKGRNRGTVKIWDEDVKVWGDLPLLGTCMREAWNSRPGFDGTGQDASTVSEWVSLNSFAARIHGASLQDWTNFGIWELRSTLEEDVPASGSVRDACLSSASEWLAHAGKELHAKVGTVQEMDEATARSLRAGSKLGKSISGVTEDRWKFWRDRLIELSPEASEGVQKKTETVVGLMKGWDGTQ